MDIVILTEMPRWQGSLANHRTHLTINGEHYVASSNSEETLLFPCNEVGLEPDYGTSIGGNYNGLQLDGSNTLEVVTELLGHHKGPEYALEMYKRAMGR